ncbi:MAG: PEP/pyruvate-binding domain-containing protein, partial [Acidobacteriota bacterium]
MSDTNPHVLDFTQVGAGDVALVGGKCASLGELFRELTGQGVRAVDGFSTTSNAYHTLLETDGLRNRLKKLLKGLDTNNLEELARVGSEARSMMLETPFPKDVEVAILESYKRLGDRIGKKAFGLHPEADPAAEQWVRRQAL